jgi:beta-phosphoglucomutase-like phosphatase (HAD superfamily)
MVTIIEIYSVKPTPAPVAQAPQPAVVFDVDGTVLDGAPAMLNMYRKAAAARRAGKRAVDLFIPELNLGAGRTLHCHFGRKRQQWQQDLLQCKSPSNGSQ